MFVYTANDTESDKRIKNNNLQYKHTKNTKMYFQQKKRYKIKDEHQYLFNKKEVQNDKQFIVIFMALFIICIFCIFCMFRKCCEKLAQESLFIRELPCAT